MDINGVVDDGNRIGIAIGSCKRRGRGRDEDTSPPFPTMPTQVSLDGIVNGGGRNNEVAIGPITSLVPTIN